MPPPPPRGPVSQVSASRGLCSAGGGCKARQRDARSGRWGSRGRAGGKGAFVALAWVLTGACGAGTREGRGERGGVPLAAALGGRGYVAGAQREETVRMGTARAEAAVVTLRDAVPLDASSVQPTVSLRRGRDAAPANGSLTGGGGASSHVELGGGESAGVPAWGEAGGDGGFDEGFAFGGADVCIHDNCVRGATHGPQGTTLKLYCAKHRKPTHVAILPHHESRERKRERAGGHSMQSTPMAAQRAGTGASVQSTPMAAQSVTPMAATPSAPRVHLPAAAREEDGEQHASAAGLPFDGGGHATANALPREKRRRECQVEPACGKAAFYGTEGAGPEACRHHR
ncbi:hypothetical protein T484DRAFT_3068479 [Baffinella frigidus]|nr:hypothetical protein T484DRAFT_3068479 [Cryptophyta sp. CCMP2293]